MRLHLPLLGAAWTIATILAVTVLGACSSGDNAEPTLAPSPTSPATAAASPMPVTATPPATISTPGPEPSASTAPAAPARVVYRGNPDRRIVALTFDAGSDTGFTADILTTLRRENVRATFGITGAWAERNRDLVLAIAADGHSFINHSYDHTSFTGASTGDPPLTAEERALQVSRTETTVYHLSQRTTRPYFRPPYGDLDESVRHDVAAAGYDTIVMWTVDTLGWKQASADEIVARSLAQAVPGAIYVMHVGSQSQDAAALPRVIEGLRAAGYEFGTIQDVLR